jgi:SAM-dependent methyltransferase
MVMRMRSSRAPSAAGEGGRGAPERVRERFRERAQAFDDLYEDERPLVRLLRPGLLRRRNLAVDAVREYSEPRVLDVGCGSGRIGEFVLEAGARDYVGVDFSEPMIELAREGRGFFVPTGGMMAIQTDDPLELFRIQKKSV